MATTRDDFITQAGLLVADKSNGTIESSDWEELLNRSVRRLQTKSDWYNTKDYATINVFDDIYEYPAPTGYFKMAQLQNRLVPVDFRFTSSKEFWQRKDQFNYFMAEEERLGNRFLLIKYLETGANLQIHSMDSLTDNGSWIVDAATDATNIRIDEVIKREGEASIAFDIDVSLSGTDTAAIQNNSISTVVDLADYEDKGSFFFDLELPAGLTLTSVTLLVGSDLSNYVSGDITTQYNGLSFREGWNKVGIAWSDMTETGTFDVENTDTVKITLNYASSQTSVNGVHVDDLRVKNPTELDLDFYSTSFITDGTTGNLKSQFEAGDDVTTLDTEHDDLVLYWTVEQGLMLMDDVQASTVYGQKAREVERILVQRFPSERSVQTNYWYEL